MIVRMSYHMAYNYNVGVNARAWRILLHVTVADSRTMTNKPSSYMPCCQALVSTGVQTVQDFVNHIGMSTFRSSATQRKQSPQQKQGKS